MATRKKRSAFVPRIVLSGLSVSVVPACIAVGCSSSSSGGGQGPIVALAQQAFDAAADHTTLDATDASYDGTVPVIALAQQGFDSGADTGTPDDASGDG
jgi:hypothetical protein